MILTWQLAQAFLGASKRSVTHSRSPARKVGNERKLNRLEVRVGEQREMLYWVPLSIVQVRVQRVEYVKLICAENVPMMDDDEKSKQQTHRQSDALAPTC